MRYLIMLCLITSLLACKSDTEYQKATDPQEAAREFIRSSLDGNYEKALFYLYKDSAEVNKMLLTKWKSDYDKWSAEDKVGHKESSIIVVTTENVNDSTLNYVFYNNYRPDTTTIKVVKKSGEWLVDLQDIH